MMVLTPDAVEVKQLLNRPDLDQAAVDEAVNAVVQFVKAYTNGHGFTVDAGECEEAIASVIITASARLAVNPAQVESESADGYSTRGAFNAFSVPEVLALNRYRRRTA